MNKLPFMVVIFLLVFTTLSVIKQRVKLVDRQIKELELIKKNLNNELGILKAEWALLNSPKNIEKLSKIYFKFKPSNLLDEKDLSESLLLLGRFNSEWKVNF